MNLREFLSWVRSFFLNSRLLALAVLLAAAVTLAGTVSYLPLETQATLAWGLVAMAVVLKQVLRHRPLFLQSLLMMITLFVGLRYFFFRTTETLVYTGPLAFLCVLCLFGAELYALLIQILGMFVNALPMHRDIKPINLSNPDLPSVDVLIPTYSEPEQMVAITAGACSQLEYPREKLNIYILDDGGTLQRRNDPDPQKADSARQRHETLKTLAGFLEINYRTRAKNEYAKAGNINQALYGVTDGQPNPDSKLVVILDCDHVPTRDFLKNTVGEFMQDPNLFLLQTPHFFINPDPIERNLESQKTSPGNNEMFYCKVLPGLDFWDAAFFCGSAAVLRRKCLDESQGIAGDTITEDAETALFLHGRGYSSAYIGKPMVCGLSPETFDDFIIQRNRWAQGMVQILLLKNPLFKGGLTLCQKICYLNTCAFWFFGLARFMFMTAPFLFLFLNLRVYHATLAQCLSYPIPYLFISMTLSNFMYGKVRHPFFSELYEMVMSFFNIPAVLSVIRSPKSPAFTVTPKGTSLDEDRPSGLAYPFYILLALSLLMYPVAVFKLSNHPTLLGAIAISTIWGTYNFVLLLMSLGVVWERRQIRKTHRIEVSEDVTIRIRSDERSPASIDTPSLSGTTTDLSEEGMGIKVPADADISQGIHVDIKTTDSSGKSFTLWAKIIHVHPRKEEKILGCQFQYEDELSFYNITDYVYGDSNRWDRYWKKRQNDISFNQGMVYVLKLGISGTWRHLRGIFSKALRWPIRPKEEQWNVS